MSDGPVNCPRCSAVLGAEIPIPVTVTPIKGGVHVEGYYPCPHCGCVISYDQVPEEPEEPVKTKTVGWLVEWAYNDGERCGSGSRTFGADELAEAEAYCASMSENPDNYVSLWPIEKEIRTPLEYCTQALSKYDLAVRAPESGFSTFKSSLKGVLNDLLESLTEVNRAWEAALAEEALITLQIVQTAEDLEASNLHGDLVQIQRRLTQ